MEFLQRAVIGQSWAREPLSLVATNGLTFRQLNGELEVVVQLEKKSRLVVAQDRFKTPWEKFEEPGMIHYTRKGGYHHGQRLKSTNRPDPLSIKSCFNCDYPRHKSEDYPNPANFSRPATRKPDYFNKKEYA